MANEETRDTGIPTRAIHEAYLSMQRAHLDFRRARDGGGPAQQAQGAFQDAVLGFYELVRPHLKRQGSLSRFWQGELPDYPDRWWQSVDEARQFCQQCGTAVWTLQKHVQTDARSPNVQGGAGAVADGGGSPAEWHDRLNLTDRQRVVAVDVDDGMTVWVELRATMGLAQLDSWDTRKRRERQRGDGFMSSEASDTVRLEYVAPAKLVRAKRLLAEAADKMNLLSRIDIDHDDGAIVNFDQSRDDAEVGYRNAEYDSSPDI